ncbi:MAG: MG2 domain-containing protein [Bacteroides sp.]|uniref:alpha-2-macroglobulin family protein n=1 Tax=Bacteroides sp. TaxID=29523 RepID=UPI002FC69B4F
MKQVNHFPTTYLLILFAMAIGIVSCSRSQKEVIPSAAFAPYVNAYTGGNISQSSPIRIELTQEQAAVDLNQELKENPFDFSPSLKGKAYWINNSTIEFLPEEGALKPGEMYEARFHLGDFVQVEKELKEFDFSFRVQENNFALQLQPIEIEAGNPNVAIIKGSIRFSDKANSEQVGKMLSASNGAKITVSATTSPSLFEFAVAGIARQKSDLELTLTADGSPAGIDRKISESIIIPAQGSFRFLSAQRIDEPENGIEVVFSDPLSMLQDLKGLIELPELSAYIFEVKNNKVNIYFEPSQLSKLTLNIHQGVKNFDEKPLGNSHSIAFSELNLKPQVEIKKAGAIIPDSKNLIIPFRAVSLYAVDLSVIRIFESNVLQFMQTNSLESGNELRRSGRLVYKKRLVLTSDPSKDVRRWEDYSIDLAGLIKQEPGAIYRVVLSFKQAYSAYPCGGGNSNRSFAPGDAVVLTNISDGLPSAESEAEWDTPQAYYYYTGGEQPDWSEYQWEERDNPCHPSYYMLSDRSAACNVLASNLGLTVKRNSLNKLWVAVNNLLDTQPVKKATVTAYNFQLQPIAQAESDDNGFATLIPKGVPFMVVAEADKQKAYVKVADGEELSVSRFDVGGKDIQKGLKGFVYGDRGVWRPGDTLHLSFMLEDRLKRIPDKHPVVLELYNPRGQFYTKQLSTNGLNGLYTFHVGTQPNDPTGLWNAYIKVGGTTFHKPLRVETVKPNRLKINLTLPVAIIKASAKKLPTTLTANWLTGATASHLKATVEMSLNKVETQFQGYQHYLFNNPATNFTVGKMDLFTGTLDANGRTAFTLDLPQATNAPGMLRANITTRVFEPGGDASISTLTVPYSPFTSYVGINLNQPKGRYMETDKNHTFDVVTLNAEGRPVDRGNLEYKIYRIDWNWWWSKADESFETYINSTAYTPVATGRLSTHGGKAQIGFRVNYPDWGRYLVYVKDNESGHATGGTIYIDWPDWRGRSGKTDPSGITMLAFSIDKEKYAPGETVTTIIPAAAGGRALVAIENGSEVLHREWIEVSPKGDTKYQFKVTPEMAPNVYLHISLLQPHAQTVNDLPIRMYGVIPVFVSNRQTVLEPQINMPAVLRPEQEFSVSVSEKSGKPMTYTLAIVDDGLLDLTNFKTPDPWNDFYAREALGIRTWDMFDSVLGAFTGSYSSLFSTGGDEALKPSDAKANRFKPVVKFIGPFALAKGKTQTHRITLPMYVGSVRTMVVAGQDGAYGNAEKTTPVRTPLMLLSTLPRVLSTNEEILVPVNVFAMENQVKEVSVSLTTTGKAQIVGEARKTVRFAKTGDQLLFFRLKTHSKTGKETIRLTASGGGQTTKEQIEIEVRNPNPAITFAESKWVESGKSCELPYALQGTAAESSIRLEVSRLPSVDLSRRMDFLTFYPHACTEQLTSKAIPLLYLAQFKTLTETENKAVQSGVQDAIKELYARQLPNGGFVYWPGNAVANEWISSYAGMFLSLAQEKGYAVNAPVLERWKRFQRMAAQNWKPIAADQDAGYWQSDLQQAYRLYTLSLAGAPELGAMNRMKEMPQLSAQAKWRLAAAYALNGKMKPAQELVYQAKTTVEPYSLHNTIYGSSDRDEAMILETLLLMKRKQEALTQAQRVSTNLLAESAFSTQSTAFSLLAMGQLAESLSGTLNFTWTLNGRVQPAVKSAKALFVAPIATSPRNGTVTVKQLGSGALKADLIVRTQLLTDTLPARADNLRLDVRYTDLNGMPVSIEKMKQGTDFQAIITVANISGTTDYTNLALTQIVPSGWEIYNERLAGQAAGANYSYQDIRDDRVLTYFDLKEGESKTFTTRLQATYAGEFVCPAVQCEAMYDVHAQARTKAGRILVER